MSGAGDAAYPNGMNGQGCSSGTALGGKESIYQFVVPSTGTYQLNGVADNSSWVDYYYKRNNAVCNNTGWTCLNRVFSTPVGIGGFNWTAGDTILLLLNAEATGQTSQSFKITCAASVCTSITTITCNDTVQFSSFGYGRPDYPNGMNGQGCSSGTSQGGQESIYQFVVPTTGTYQLNGVGDINAWVDYYYKRNNAVCSNTGWTCLNRILNTPVGIGGFNWTAGDTILLLLNAESTSQTSQSFKITCAASVCTSITTINCNETIQFSSFGYGSPDYPNGMNGQGCSSGTSQGGQETIYQFIVPTTGTYQLNGVGDINAWVDYYYKRNNAVCSNTGWTCLNRVLNTPVGIGGFNWTAGDTILLLLNAESTGQTSQSFKITCAASVCTSITTINCNETIQFSAFGYGSPDYPNGMNGQGCSSGTSQGGQETIYQFIVPTTGTYQLNGVGDNNSWADYYYKRNNAVCSNTGWTCLNRVLNTPVGIGGFNWTAGDTILLLLNAEATGQTLQSFKISCAVSLCATVKNIAYGDTARFEAFGFGDIAYPNGMNGQGCSSGTLQGGQESIYRFLVPFTGAYKLNITSDNNSWVDYYYKRNNAVCNNGGWTCIGRILNAGTLPASFNWTAGDTILFLLNAEATGSTAQSFILCNGLPPVANFNYGISSDNVGFVNSSTNYLNCLWTFGDGTTSTLANPLHIYAHPGSYNVCLKVNNACGTQTKCQTILISGIQSITPNKVAGTGVYTFDVKGSGFSNLDTFFYSKPGQPPIYADSIIRLGNNRFRARFHFTNVAVGSWSANARLQSGDTLRLNNALQVNIPTPDPLRVTITGSRVLRVGFNQVYTVSVYNPGLEDAYFVQCFIEGLPPNTRYEFLTDENNLIGGRQIPEFNSLNIDWDEVDQQRFIDPPTNTSFYPFMLPKIPAGGTRTVDMVFHIPDTTPLHSLNRLSAKAAKPFFTSTDLAASANGYKDYIKCGASLTSLILNNFAGNAGSCIGGLADFGRSAYEHYYESHPTTLTEDIIKSADIHMGLMETFESCAITAGLTVLTVNLPAVAAVGLGLYKLLTIRSQLLDVDTDCLESGVAGIAGKDILDLIIGNAWDPNDKIGPGSNSYTHYYNKKDRWNYSILFENDSAAALSAQKIILIDTLDISKFDLSTFQFTTVTLGRKSISLNNTAGHVLADMNLVNQYGVIARTTADIDTSTGIIKWVINTIDPITNQVTTDPAAGILPPDTDPPIGQGSVGFSVKLRDTVSEGNWVKNRASILFDSNPAIETPEWTCTVDTVQPSSNVASLSPVIFDTSFLVSWHGADNRSGVESYSIFVSRNHGPWYPWINNTFDTSATFTGLINNRYSFYSVSTDSAGNSEIAALTSDAETLLKSNFEWIGINDTDWRTAANWSGGIVPGTNDDVVIPGGTAFMLKIPAGITVYCRSIAILPSAVVTVSASGHIVITK